MDTSPERDARPRAQGKQFVTELLALSAAGLAILIDMGYLAIIYVGQHDAIGGRVASIGGLIAAAAVCLLATVAIQTMNGRLALGTFAASVLVILAVLASMSIGVLLAVPAVLAVLTCQRLAVAVPSRTAAAISVGGFLAALAGVAISLLVR